ncbi:AraC-like DNA-binding protein [Actinoplanes lutulentus]|uniref:AraC-like protein n=1 Tax=Actinoplanes lutulentus TaxID=1287878 RepID=A0A327Z1F7_9ACTN|nr:AraC family transcriptional regulator [Actinoplanes lutulentus]MBB2943634.1 AraC-like DNA-binding protein [Actinoplanes lutulentus]RAK27499.1 AraC-like protein [Actinoplanes lutulentus]
MPAASGFPGPQIDAWRPPLDGVVEVLHARFGEHGYPMHAHDAWTVLLVDDGAVRYDLDRHERGAYGDLVTLLPPKVPHNGTAAGPRGFRKRVLYLEPHLLPQRLIGASVDTPAITDRTLHRLVSSVHRVLRTQEEAAAEALLAVALERLRTHLGDPAAPSAPTRDAAHGLRDLLEEHIVEGLPLSAASAQLHFDPAHLVRSFRREFGMSPHQYLISRRVDLARRMIVAGHPLRAAATDAGFYDQPHLTRHFKRILGVPPSHFTHP